jgi:hypothetical protein
MQGSRPPRTNRALRIRYVNGMELHKKRLRNRALRIRYVNGMELHKKRLRMVE